MITYSQVWGAGATTVLPPGLPQISVRRLERAVFAVRNGNLITGRQSVSGMETAEAVANALGD